MTEIVKALGSVLDPKVVQGWKHLEGGKLVTFRTLEDAKHCASLFPHPLTVFNRTHNFTVTEPPSSLLDGTRIRVTGLPVPFSEADMKLLAQKLAMDPSHVQLAKVHHTKEQHQTDKGLLIFSVCPLVFLTGRTLNIGIARLQCTLADPFNSCSHCNHSGHTLEQCPYQFKPELPYPKTRRTFAQVARGSTRSAQASVTPLVAVHSPTTPSTSVQGPTAPLPVDGVPVGSTSSPAGYSSDVTTAAPQQAVKTSPSDQTLPTGVETTADKPETKCSTPSASTNSSEVTAGSTPSLAGSTPSMAASHGSVQNSSTTATPTRQHCHSVSGTRKGDTSWCHQPRKLQYSAESSSAAEVNSAAEPTKEAAREAEGKRGS